MVQSGARIGVGTASKRARTRWTGALLTGAALALTACAEPPPVELGPVDGHDLPGIDLERVKVGEEAPDFALLSYRGDTLQLSEYRGAKRIILVFYRGSW